MLSILIIVLRPDDIAGPDLGFGQRQIPFIVSACV